MSSPFDAITYGPFYTEYHLTLVDDAFKGALIDFLNRTVTPQVDHDCTLASGKVTATFNDDKYCGPNSLVRDRFKVVLEFHGANGDSRLEATLEYYSIFKQFVSHQDVPLYLWTPTRQQRSEAEQKVVVELCKRIHDDSIQSGTCPLCGAELNITNTLELFNVLCSRLCFKYNFHKDDEGNRLHGHFFMNEPGNVKRTF